MGILNIRKSISSINWSHLFSDKHIDIQVSIFEECVLNVFKNFVPNKYVVFDNKEPVWMDQSIKQLIKEYRIHVFLNIRVKAVGMRICILLKA